MNDPPIWISILTLLPHFNAQLEMSILKSSKVHLLESSPCNMVARMPVIILFLVLPLLDWSMFALA